MENLTVGTLYNETHTRLLLEIVNGTYSFRRVVKDADLHRPGLALSGFTKVFTYDRVQILGNTELRYLDEMTPHERMKTLKPVLNFDIPCLIVTDDNRPPHEMVELANKRGITIFRTSLKTTKLTHLLGEYLDEKFAPKITVHGSLVDVYGIGVLFTGRSGIGKSEIALDLVERGHRLVADDVVQISRKAAGILIGQGTELLQHHMEIRGLGIIDVRSIFGIRSIRAQKRIEVEVHLEEWDSKEDYERIGIDEQKTTILEVEMPYVKLPIFPGKNITVIAEVIALNQLLKIAGHHMAREFNEKLVRKIQERSEDHIELEKYLQRDFE
ncbi:HPr kinase/phosphorylase [bacterium]|nr:MAG: HPr kinase/phosphorylase [candidate division KSB1 bacterium]MCE7942159.1 HPr kinase/phosphorylase [Chlorobi bacterium CHB1]MCL4706248.1 HPr kinase/phosphorylase [bacterium]MDL1873947.1 HPr kinase/phosphorylase [Cytophagia bacterium CHB2]MBC6951352.1 HPr kinase/phosphorylase [candidate division KSB1 bacterium]